MESALYGIYALVFVSRTHSFAALTSISDTSTIPT